MACPLTNLRLTFRSQKFNGRLTAVLMLKVKYLRDYEKNEDTIYTLIYLKFIKPLVFGIFFFHLIKIMNRVTI